MIPTCFQRAPRRRHWLSLALFSAIVSGCSSAGDTDAPLEPEATELKASKDVQVVTDAPPTYIVRNAERLFEAKLFTVAKQAFENLRDAAPGGAYSHFAELKLADCHFYNREYPAAAALYEEHFKSNPGSLDAEYSVLQAAKSHIRSNRGVGRDKAPLEKALTLLDTLLKTFPNSRLVPEASAERMKVAELLSEHDKLIVEFYESQDRPEAAQAREALARKRFQALLAEKTKVDQTDRPMQRVDLRSGPALPPALARVRSVGTRAGGSPATLGKRKTTITAATVVDTPEIALLRVQCRSAGSRFLTFELSRAPDKAIDTTFSPNDGRVVFALRGIATDGAVIDCFAAKDLEILPSGEVSLAVDSPVRLTSLMEPPRLLLMVQ
jgi:outer membrane assembly lipoprotein YfiO